MRQGAFVSPVIVASHGRTVNGYLPRVMKEGMHKDEGTNEGKHGLKLKDSHRVLDDALVAI